MPLATVYGKINLMDGQEVPISSRNPFGVLLENTNPESLHPILQISGSLCTIGIQ